MKQAKIILNQIMQLEEFQKEQLIIQLQDLINHNIEAKDITYKKCPKCNANNPRIGTRGTTKAGKIMMHCKECDKRFVFDHGLYSYYSHSSQSQWNEVIKHTLLLTSIKETASLTNIHEDRIFTMRHKILYAIEKIIADIILDNTSELDEKYVRFPHKGKPMNNIDMIIKSNRKRGLSNNVCCLITGASRKGYAYSSIVNMGAPKAIDIYDVLASKISEESEILFDGNTSYNYLVAKTKSIVVVVSRNNKTDKSKHLNNINSFHSKIHFYIKQYRNVSSKYLNRYCALFSLLWNHKDLDIGNFMLKILGKFKKSRNYARIKDLFIEPDILENKLCQQITG